MTTVGALTDWATLAGRLDTPTELLIDGQWVPALGGARLDVVSPIDGSIIRSIALGAAADIDFAIFAFNYLRQTFFRCWNEFKRTHANPDKASYYRGLRDGLNAELKAAKQRAEESYATEQRQTYGLVVVDQQAVITRYVEENYGKLRNRNTRSRRLHSGSYTAGETKGRTIQINRPLPS
jgi:hypothetical protein